jgi:hypothetical protein
MVDRRFSEVDLRAMLVRARGFRKDLIPGRWVIEASLRRTRWEIIVEPDHDVQLLVVVTAYPIQEG